MTLKYLPEMLMMVMATLQNIVLFCACAWTVVTLYRLSHSWHCLWALLMLTMMVSKRFVRD
jgi:hypothetical protein